MCGVVRDRIGRPDSSTGIISGYTALISVPIRAETSDQESGVGQHVVVDHTIQGRGQEITPDGSKPEPTEPGGRISSPGSIYRNAGKNEDSPNVSSHQSIV